MALTGFKSIPINLAQLSLDAVLKCGQSFRWSTLALPLPENAPSTQNSAVVLPEDFRVEYRLCLKDRVVCLRQSTDTLYYRAVFPDPQPLPTTIAVREAETLEWLKDYFQLDIDLVCLYHEWSTRDQVFARFKDRFEGIRMLRQDPWENLISFICSSNNNISRITKMIQNLCIHYSAPLLSIEHPSCPSEILTYHPFPLPSALAGSEVNSHLRSLGFGYRAEYIQRTAKILVDAHGVDTSGSSSPSAEIAESWLRGLRKRSTSDAREELLKFVGVGRKVADCVLLMSLDKTEVVPVDTHVFQIATKYYGLKSPNGGKVNMTPKIYEDLNSKFYGIWGEYAGWAHSVLFTADLKSFSTYGLAVAPPIESPTATPQEHKNKNKAHRKNDLMTPTRSSSSRSPLKRGLPNDIEPEPPIISKLCEETVESMNLVDRIKKRRRNL